MSEQAGQAPAPGHAHLDALESESVHIIREAYATLGRLALLWSPGKDSNVLVWLCRKAFFGHVPFRAVHLDTGRTFAEMDAFRERQAAAWGLTLITAPCPPDSEIDPSLPPAARSAARKTAGLKAVIGAEGFTGILAGIRHDEEGTRAKERVFSPRGSSGEWDFRGQPPEFWDQYNSTVPAGGHVRVHPLLHWSEIDIWRYTAREGIPAISLYFAKEGKRYRSLGDEDITHPVASEASTIEEIIAELEVTRVAERASRAMDAEIRAYLAALGWAPRQVVPAAAREGDNIASASPRTPRYAGPGLLDALGALDAPEAASEREELPFRMPVQGVYHVDERRIIAGRIESGRVSAGDRVLFSPSNKAARVASIEAWNTPGPVNEAGAGRSIGLTLDALLFVERGETVSHAERPPIETDVFRARLFWLGRTPLSQGRRCTLRLGARAVEVEVQSIERVIDPDKPDGRESGDAREEVARDNMTRAEVARDGIAEVVLRTRAMLALDAFTANPRTGRFVLADGNEIAGGGLIGMEGYADQRALITGRSSNVAIVDHGVSAAARARRNGHAGGVIWLTGLSGAGKSTLAIAAEDHLFRKGYQVYALDGDNVRHGLNATLGFSPEDRAENIRRVGEVAALFAEAGFIVLTAFISPYRSDRERARAAAERASPGVFHEVYVQAPLAVCEARDPKGLYRRARAGEIADFTGVSAPYEPPDAPEFTVDTGDRPVEQSVQALIDYIERQFALSGDAASEG